MRVVVSAVAILLLLGGCVMQQSSLPTPPALPAETIPLPPVSEEELTWQPGDWLYVGGSYRYESGHYVARGGQSAAWVFGHWAGTPPNEFWVPGGWN